MLNRVGHYVLGANGSGMHVTIGIDFADSHKPPKPSQADVEIIIWIIIVFSQPSNHQRYGKVTNSVSLAH